MSRKDAVEIFKKAWKRTEVNEQRPHKTISPSSNHTMSETSRRNGVNPITSSTTRSGMRYHNNDNCSASREGIQPYKTVSKSLKQIKKELQEVDYLLKELWQGKHCGNEDGVKSSNQEVNNWKKNK